MVWHSTRPTDDRKYQVKVQQNNLGKYTWQVLKPHTEAQLKKGVCWETERPKASKNTYSSHVLFNQFPAQTGYLNKISKFTGNYSLWKVIGISEKKVLQNYRVFRSLLIFQFHGHSQHGNGKQLPFLLPTYLPRAGAIPRQIAFRCKMLNPKGGFLKVLLCLRPCAVQAAPFLIQQTILSFTRDCRELK